MHPHLIPLTAAIICSQQMLTANAECTNLSLSPTYLVSGMTILRIALSITATMLERIIPAASAFMPDQAPLFVALWSACSLLSLRIPYIMARS
jgi:hypothetical protein